jgi:hypothetical protein
MHAATPGILNLEETGEMAKKKVEPKEPTQEQINSFRERVLRTTLAPGPVNVEGLRPVLNQMYEHFKLAAPEIVRVPSPTAAIALIAERNGEDPKDQAIIKRIMGECQWGSCDGVWVSYYEFFCDELRIEHDAELRRQLQWWIELRDGSYWWWPYDTTVVLSDKPETKWDAADRFHCEDGPAISFTDGTGAFYWHGVQVPLQVILFPEAITLEQIDKEPNAEIRRVMVTRYGPARWLHDAGAERVHEDDFGILYRSTRKGDSPLCMVKVVNSTPEPDGSYKDYYLRVPSNMQSARQAVAWTFYKEEHEYNPELET